MGAAPLQTESGLTRTVTILGLGCLLLTGVTGGLAAFGNLPGLSSSSDDETRNSVAVARHGPIANREGKTDRLAPAALMAALEPAADIPTGDGLRQAYGPDRARNLPAIGTALPPIVVPQPTAKPKPVVAKDQGQKNFTLLSDAQISAIKGRLNLTSAQESYWPDIEAALRAIARKMHDTRQAKAGVTPQIDPDSAEAQQLKSAAMPLLFQLREDQKREVRALARIIGLEKVAAAI